MNEKWGENIGIIWYNGPEQEKQKWKLHQIRVYHFLCIFIICHDDIDIIHHHHHSVARISYFIMPYFSLLLWLTFCRKCCPTSDTHAHHNILIAFIFFFCRINRKWKRNRKTEEKKNEKNFSQIIFNKNWMDENVTQHFQFLSMKIYSLSVSKCANITMRREEGGVGGCLCVCICVFQLYK